MKYFINNIEGHDFSDWALDVMYDEARIRNEKDYFLFRERIMSTECIHEDLYHNKKHYAFVINKFYNNKIYMGGE